MIQLWCGFHRLSFLFISTMILYPMSLRLGISRIILRLFRSRQKSSGVLDRRSHTTYIIVSVVFVMFCKRVAVIISKYLFGSKLAVDSISFMSAFCK